MLGLDERTNAFEVMFRVMLISSFSCWELRKFLEFAAPQPWDGSIDQTRCVENASDFLLCLKKVT